MRIVNPSKAFIAFSGLICLTVLMALNKIDMSQGMPIFTLIIGYAVGNTMSASKREPVEPIIGPKDRG